MDKHKLSTQVENQRMFNLSPLSPPLRKRRGVHPEGIHSEGDLEGEVCSGGGWTPTRTKRVEEKNESEVNSTTFLLFKSWNWKKN